MDTVLSGSFSSTLITDNSPLCQDETPASAYNSKDDLCPPSRSTSPVFIHGQFPSLPPISVETGFICKDIRDPMAVHGSCGLNNLGNTCFMNAGIQSLASCTPLVKFFFEQFQLTESLKGTLTGTFYMLLCKMWSGQFSVVHPRQFKEFLGLYYPQFQDYRQHDCQEFLALLLDTFHEQLNQLPSITISEACDDHCSSSHTSHQNHLNNQEPSLSIKSVLEKPVEMIGPTDTLSLLCGEKLTVEDKDEDVCSSSSQGAVSPDTANLGASLTNESIAGRQNLKRVSSLPADTIAAAVISEDSNHSSISVHSTDSEQSSAFKKLKIEADANMAALQSLSHPANIDRISPSLDFLSEISAPCCSQPHLSKSSSDLKPLQHTSPQLSAASDSSLDSMDIYNKHIGSTGCIQSRKSFRSDYASSRASNSGTLAKRSLRKNSRNCNTNLDSTFLNHAEHSEQFSKPEISSVVSTNQYTFSSPSSPLSSISQASLHRTPLQPHDLAQALPCLEDYYCKETKTLNTNVLMSCFNQGDVAVDSEKFAKVDNRIQVPVTKEVNLLQEALHGLDGDKVEKTLIGKNLRNKCSNLNTGVSTDEKDMREGNLRTVKSRSGFLRKARSDPNALNNSYDFDEDVLALGAEKSLQDENSKLEDTAVGLKMTATVPEAMKPLEVEKNVQMQALSKFNTAMAKSNIREDISDKVSMSESTETEEADMEIEAESSDEGEDEEDEEDEEEEETTSRGSAAEENTTLPNPARCFTAADVAAANASWENYKARNNSVIVDTFQGQFKSTVVCSECNHVSVTYEPFMYLSLPIPHAMERQICVVFIRPCDTATRYMVTLHKNDKVQRLRRELQTMTGTEKNDVILAEVLDNHVSRLLDDSIMLRYVNDSTRTIYAFEMLPPPEIGNGEKSLRASSPEEHSFCFNVNSSHNFPNPSSTVTSEATSLKNGSPHTLGVSDQETSSCSGEPSQTFSDSSGLVHAFDHRLCGGGITSTASASFSRSDIEDGKNKSGSPELNYFSRDEAQDVSGQSAFMDPSLAGTGLWEWSGSEEFSSNSFTATKICLTHSSSTLDQSASIDFDVESQSCRESIYPQSHMPVDTGIEKHDNDSTFASQFWPQSGMDSGEPELRGIGSCLVRGIGLGSGVVEQWRTCAICLEEMLDSELLTHAACAGVFCNNCLEMSAKHSGDLAQCCPICLAPTDLTRDFTPLASGSAVKCKVRILAVPVTFRQENIYGLCCDGDKGSHLQLVCSPRLVYIASQMNAASLYTLIDRMAPFHSSYTLHFTDGQGLRCSRCDYTAHCPGCKVAKEGEITLQPGDNLTVQFEDPLPNVEVEKVNNVAEDKSMEKLRSRDPITIFDCFGAFTQSEVLDEHNPWYCPGCCRNQCAKKTMTVWRYPDNLIIHLKRFVFEDLSSTKVDNRVVFPHTNLDVTPFLSGSNMSFNVYNLYSIVCHYGGANSGHYTAFTCHPITHEWYHYNDESVTQQKPGETEFDTGYVLFYKRLGLDIEFTPPHEFPFAEDDFQPLMTPTSLALVPYHPPPPSPTSIVADAPNASHCSTQAEADSSHDYDFYY